jgi:hypothetical protein
MTVFKHWACRLLGHKLGHNAHGEPGYYCKRCGYPLMLGLAYAIAARIARMNQLCIEGKLDLKPETNNADSETP